MRKLQLVVLSILIAPAFALAENKIALVDPMQAMVEADEVKSSSAELESDLQDETQKLEKLRGDITAIEQKMQKEGMTMSEKQKKDLQNQRQSKVIEFRSLQQMVQKQVQEDRQELMKRMEPKLVKAVEEIAREEGYDLVITKQAVLYSGGEMEITGKVTQKLNQMQ